MLRVKRKLDNCSPRVTKFSNVVGKVINPQVAFDWDAYD